jgi:prophage regulatory protein
VITKLARRLANAKDLDSVAVSLELVGVAEVAAMLGLTTQRIDQLARRDPNFPSPVAELAAGRIWSRADIVTWARNAGRLDGDE